MSRLKGIGSKSRANLAQVLRETNGVVTVLDVAQILGIERQTAAQLLGRWESGGWISRIKRGVYSPIALESKSTDVAVKDPWVLAQKLYSPCYIGGWSALEYWDLTEQIFHSTLVMTSRLVRSRKQTLKGARLQIRTVKERALFGFKPVWVSGVKVNTTDPTRTILDLFVDPTLGGGIRSCIDAFRSYCESEHKDLKLLVEYGERLDNSAAFKRIGFLLETFFPSEAKAIAACRRKIKSGYSQLDPRVKSKRLVTSWHLWVPESLLTEDQIK